MRGFFVWLLKIQAWLTPVASAYYGYVIFNVHDSNAGFIGAMFGFAFGWLGYVWFAGLADLAETIWGEGSNSALEQLNERISTLTDKVNNLAKGNDTDHLLFLRNKATEMKASVDDLHVKVGAIKTSADDLHEGLSDVMEETLKGISSIKTAVDAPAKVITPKLDLSAIPESGNL